MTALLKRKTDGTMESLTDKLREILKGGNVLALPQSATRVLELSKNPDNGPAELEIPILADPGLSVQVLRFANSSFFGFSHKITTVRSALTLISVRTISNFVLWNAVFSLLPNPRIGTFHLRCFYQDALRRAVFCKILAEYYDVIHPEQIFVSGLFQDIALPVLIQNLPGDYTEILHRREQSGMRISDLEQSRFGWNHAQAAGFFMDEWGIGDEVARHVSRHIRIESETLDTTDQIASAIVCLSGLLPGVVEQPKWEDVERFFMLLRRVQTEGRNRLKSPIPVPAELLEKVDVQYKDMLTVARLPVPEFSLCDCQNEYYRSLEEGSE